MSTEAPERIWVWPDTIDEMGSSVNRDKTNGYVEYVRIDKLEELAAENERWREQRRHWRARAIDAEAALAEKDKETAALKRLNEGLHDELQFMRSALKARNAGGNDAE